ncbi:Histidine kinase-, DNA gyrase B-, and HSP90-like ATPase [Robiginitalea myxolifaciens]|uniref:histidine kinase n=1 Tax=Robiginitalea myxolifaciens TaxID=400055 RepID=A0A1I6H2V0_9FLAO|nr:ATP-binding protein [Robiginitalea myxolifaciens]SFR48681.1 Histidine kinase-, DNA gyrase B-, and HSP90-like ATPase [Robiginitalea myxolifaciens]
MASRNFYIQLIFRVFGIAAAAILMAYSQGNQWWITFGISLAILFGLVLDLIRYINSTNRKIAYFFDAIRNEDFTLRFPERVDIESFKELNQSLNRVNGLIQEVHIQLQIRENYYQEILRQARIGILTYNQKGHILFSNPTVERLFNHSPLNHVRQLEQIDPKLYALFSSFEPFDRKLYQLTNEREQHQLALKSTPVVLKDEPLLLVVVQDIRYELDEKETESWIRLIRVLTHEIMNTIAPITSISESVLKYFQSGQENPALFGEQRKLDGSIRGLEVIQGQSANLMEFVESYRTLLNVPKPIRQLIPLSELFQKLQIMAEGSNDTNTPISWEIAPEDLEIYADEKLITQTMLNLIRNARQALGQQADRQIRVRGYFNGAGQKTIAVADNGPGIPEELKDEIFVPFFTTKEKGSGIGLSLSRQIMHLHGGELKLVSTPDSGTEFRLVF